MNKQKDRLVELLEESSKRVGEYIDSRHIIPSAEEVHSLRADHLLANGVIVSPCKVGDTAYFLIEDTVAGKKYISPEPIVDVCTKGFYTSGHKDSDENGDLWLWSDVGRIVYLGKEEAEEGLKARGRDVIC